MRCVFFIFSYTIPTVLTYEPILSTTYNMLTFPLSFVSSLSTILTYVLLPTYLSTLRSSIDRRCYLGIAVVRGAGLRGNGGSSMKRILKVEEIILTGTKLLSRKQLRVFSGAHLSAD